METDQDDVRRFDREVNSQKSVWRKLFECLNVEKTVQRNGEFPVDWLFLNQLKPEVELERGKTWSRDWSADNSDRHDDYPFEDLSAYRYDYILREKTRPINVELVGW
jgi:hypothetical protein